MCVNQKHFWLKRPQIGAFEFAIQGQSRQFLQTTWTMEQAEQVSKV
jgi:hypothetical protein